MTALNNIPEKGLLIIPITNKDEPKVAHAVVTAIPDGKVLDDDGQIVDRAGAEYLLFPHNEDPTRFIAKDGVEYKRLPNGSLKRLTPKNQKHTRRHHG